MEDISKIQKHNESRPGIVLGGFDVDVQKAVPIGTVNAHGKIKTADGWVYQKKGRGSATSTKPESKGKEKKLDTLGAIKHLSQQGYPAHKIRFNKESSGTTFKVDGKVIGRINTLGKLVDVVSANSNLNTHFQGVTEKLGEAKDGSIATGGGYGSFEKIRGFWRNKKTGRAISDSRLGTTLGGFNDFKIKEGRSKSPGMTDAQLRATQKKRDSGDTRGAVRDVLDSWANLR